MAFTPAITLVVAQRIFEQFNIQEATDGRGGYVADYFGEQIGNKGLTALCVVLVKRLISDISVLKKVRPDTEAET